MQKIDHFKLVVDTTSIKVDKIRIIKTEKHSKEGQSMNLMKWYAFHCFSIAASQ